MAQRDAALSRHNHSVIGDAYPWATPRYRFRAFLVRLRNNQGTIAPVSWSALSVSVSVSTRGSGVYRGMATAPASAAPASGHFVRSRGEWQRDADTPLGLKLSGFSVQRPNHRRDSPMALSAPLNVSGCVLIAVRNIPTPGTYMGPHRERFVDPFPTDGPVWLDIGTLLGGVSRRHRFRSLASPFCLACEDG
jgi:hypothetical protein